MTNAVGRIKRLAKSLRMTPLHPQWLLFREEPRNLARLCQTATGRVLDIGCGDGRLRPHLPDSVTYVSLDYPSTGARYASKPSAFGDAQRLPFRDHSFDTVFLLEVMEHLPEPERALQEAIRVLRPGGQLVFSVPFLYPLHDEPFDFQRWTQHGLHRLFAAHALKVEQFWSSTSSVAAVGVLQNLLLARAALNVAARSKVATAILSLALLPIFVASNAIHFGLAFLIRDRSFMPGGYSAVLRKDAALNKKD